MLKLTSLFGLLMLLPQLSFSQKTQDEEIFDRLLKNTDKNTRQSSILYFAKQFLGKPYVGHTLEGNKQEVLVVNLREFDCVTLVENVVALAQTQHSAKPDFQTFKENLQKIRYRKGKIEDYASRLHYFSDWLYEHQQDGMIELLNKKWGGVIYEKPIYFMSRNANKYPQLGDKEVLAKIVFTESALNRRHYYYIPKTEIAKIENQIEDGDIISICTNVVGLDFSHEGFAFRQNGHIYLLHASSEHKKMMISELPLVDYLASHKAQIGIVVARLK